MKKIIFCISAVLAAFFVFNACNEENFSAKEYYEYVVYLMSRETRNYQNIYNVSHPYNEGVETIGYISVGCGGSLSNPVEITVELELDNTPLELYNDMIDSDDKARLLPENRYYIPGLTAVLPANSVKPYAKLPVFVVTDGLSPDSMYVIPLAIKSVSGGFQANPDKSTVLYRIVMDNYYADHLESSFYSVKGGNLEEITLEDGTTTLYPVTGYTKSRVLKPVAKYSIRMLAGEEKSEKNETFTLAELEQSAIIITVNQDDNTISYAPCGTIQVEEIENEEPEEGKEPEIWNYYSEERKNMVDESVNKYFYLRYRYRTVRTPATETQPAVYNAWKYVQEILRRVE